MHHQELNKKEKYAKIETIFITIGIQPSRRRVLSHAWNANQFAVLLFNEELFILLRTGLIVCAQKRHIMTKMESTRFDWKWNCLFHLKRTKKTYATNCTVGSDHVFFVYILKKKRKKERPLHAPSTRRTCHVSISSLVQACACNLYKLRFWSLINFFSFVFLDSEWVNQSQSLWGFFFKKKRQISL